MTDLTVKCLWCKTEKIRLEKETGKKHPLPECKFIEKLRNDENFECVLFSGMIGLSLRT